MTPVERPLEVVRFGPWGNGGAVLYTPPANTLDPRYEACSDHHVACDCREAEHAEYRLEVKSTLAALQAAIDEVCLNHPTTAYVEGVPCQCSGCVIARAVHMLPRELPF